MSLGDAYTLGVKVAVDATSLRQGLRQAKVDVESFGKAVASALDGAASQAQGAVAAERAVSRVGHAGRQQAQDTQRATQQTQQSTRQASLSFEDYQRRATKAQEDVGRASEESSRRTETSLAGLGSTLGRLTGFAGMALLVKQVWQAGIGFHEFSQNAEIAFSGMLGGLDKARAYLGDILAFAKETPFSFPELTANAQQLLAMNVAAKDVIPTLRALGDAAVSQGRGMDQVDQLARTIGQMQSLGTAGSEQLRRFQEAGIDSFKILANQAGVTTEEYQKMVREGLVPADQAIRGLIAGINDGTDGINGQTQALGGFMENLKGSGGITATTDSARSSFRNMSAELTESLIPSYVSLLRAVTSGMGTIRTASDVFNGLPEPLRNAALAFIALTVAHRLLNTQARASGVWASIRTGANEAAFSTRLAALRVGEVRLALSGVGGVGRATRSALLGAFGGPEGLAITGVAIALTSVASANSAAAGRVRELADTLDAQTGALTENTQAWISSELAKEQSFGLFGAGNQASMIDQAAKFGVSVDVITRAYEGNAVAAEQAKNAADEFERANPMSVSAEAQVYRFKRNIDDQIQRTTAAKKIVDQKAQSDAAATGQVREQGSAYRFAAGAVAQFTEEQQKAIDTAGEAARKAFLPNLGQMSLDLATENDVADARDRVEDATKRVRDAEAARAETNARDKVTAHDKVRAEEAVTEAREALEEATGKLGETEARTDPVAQYRAKIDGILEAARTFESDMRSLAGQGLNASSMADLYAAGVEGSADARKALMADPSLIDYTNVARTELDGIGSAVEGQARLTQTAIVQAGKLLGGDLGLGFQIKALESTEDTVQAIADKLGEDPDRVYQVGRTLGLTFMAGLADAAEFAGASIVHFGDGSFQTGPGAPKGYAGGGIYPGYTPGRDIGYIGVSGGEAIMRPEWTRAVGPAMVDRWNALARTAGVAGVQADMRRYLGGFAGGGTVSPQVVTVPVQVTNQNSTPWTIQQAYFTDPSAAQGWGNRARAQARKIGG